MLDLKWIRENFEELKQANAERGVKLDLEKLLGLDEKRRQVMQEVDNLRSLRNSVSAEIGLLNRQKQDSTAKVSEMQEVGRLIKNGETIINDITVELDKILLYQPNVPLPDVPLGKCAEDNPVVKTWGEVLKFDFEAKPHWELGEKLGILDFNAAAAMTGARFCVLKGWGAKLERALINFMLETHTQQGYTEVLPPFLVNEAAMTATGQLPKFKEDLFCCEKEGFYLIPTAEVPVTNLHREQILKEEDLPLYYTAYTPCFRSEAGSYGQDTRGLIRQHQFNKVELVKFTRPEDSEAELQKLLQDAERILQLLKLPYRVILLCRGDMGFSAAKTYDIEVWLPSQKRFREISSCSTFTDFQARRGKIRFRRQGAKQTEFVHTLNGSGLAVGRTLVAILENYQTASGTILVPEVLRPFLGNLTEIK